MIAASNLQAAQHRLARLYLTKLQTVEDAMRRSVVNKIYGKSLLDKEWPQIIRWQQHAASNLGTAGGWAQLCRDYGSQAINTIFFTCTITERIAWWKSALEAARLAGDKLFERTFLNKLAGEYSSLGQLDTVKTYALELLALAQSDNDLNFIANATYQLATIAEDQGYLDEAVQYYQQALALFEQLKFEVKIGRALYGLGAIALTQGDFAEAHRYFSRYQVLTDQPGLEGDHCYALQGVAEALQNLGQLDAAEAAFGQAINLARQISFQNAIGPALIGLGSCLLERGQLTEAIANLEEGMILAREYSGLGDALHALTRLGYAYWQRQEWSPALAYLLEALEKARQSQFRLHLVRIHRYLSLVYLSMGQVSESRQHLLAALLENQSLNSLPEQSQLLLTAALYAARIGSAQLGAHWLGAALPRTDAASPVATQAHREVLSALGAERVHALLTEGRDLSVETMLQQVIHQIESTGGAPA